MKIKIKFSYFIVGAFLGIFTLFSHVPSAYAFDFSLEPLSRLPVFVRIISIFRSIPAISPVFTLPSLQPIRDINSSPTITSTLTPTNSPVPQPPTPTPTLTSTPTPTVTSTPVPISTQTPTPTLTPTLTPTPTETSVLTPTHTPTPTSTLTPTVTLTPTETPPITPVSGYAYRRTITIDHTKVGGASDLTDFPIVFTGTYPYLRTTANGGKVENPNGFDIAFFSDAALSNMLKFEKVSWDGTTGASQFWVKIPVLSDSVDTVIYLAYGNNTVSSDQQDNLSTWSMYDDVFHLDETSGTTAINSPNAIYNGYYQSDLPNTARGGKIGNGQDLDGDGDYIETSHYLDFGGNDFTISVWVYPDVLNNTPVVNRWASGNWDFRINWASDDNNYMNFLYNAGGGDSGINGPSVLTGTWTHIVAVRRNNNFYFYKNGVETDEGAFTAVINSNPSSFPINIGRYAGDYGFFFDGMMDEVRVKAGTGMTASWITAEYNNQNDPSSFYSLGEENTFTPPSTPTPTPTLTPTPGSGYTPSFQDIVINEIMWMGSSKSIADEWIELKNITSTPIDLTGWVVENLGEAGAPEVANITLTISTDNNNLTIPAHGFFLISNYKKDGSILNIDPNYVTTAISLAEVGEQLTLKDNNGNIIDVANGSSGWLAGTSNPDASMARNLIISDGASGDNWHSATTSVNLDAGSSELATPKAEND